VKSFLEKEAQLHSVWYNAGVMSPPAHSRTEQGLDLQWGTNVVAHFLLHKLLLPTLVATAKTAPAGSVRTVWVSSDGHTYSPGEDGIVWEDVNDANGKLNPMQLYGQSKAGDVLLGMETARRYGPEGLVSVSLNPGHLKTELSRNYGSVVKMMTNWMLFEPRYGALTELFAGFSDEIGLENNGAYLIPWGRLADPDKRISGGFKERGTGNRLWEMLEKDVAAYL
jgi:NAD(P)-dependent dehydrogenase (short-subunit alcohol dehydrogenase family)